MSQGYPTSKLIAKIISDSGLRRSTFVKSLGYKSVEGGLRKLDAWLEQGRGDDGCLQRLVDAYRPDPGELENALTETDQMLQREHEAAVRKFEERERRRFRPFIWVHTVDGAHSIFCAMAERRAKVLWVAEGFYLSRSDKLAIVQTRIGAHYRQTGGKCAGFGKILRYQFADSFDTSMVLDIHGDVVEKEGGQFLLPEVWMELQ